MAAPTLPNDNPPSELAKLDNIKYIIEQYYYNHEPRITSEVFFGQPRLNTGIEKQSVITINFGGKAYPDAKQPRLSPSYIFIDVRALNEDYREAWKSILEIRRLFATLPETILDPEYEIIQETVNIGQSTTVSYAIGLRIKV